MTAGPPMMSEDVLTHHIALGLVTSYVLEWLKKSKWFPWLNENTDKLNKAFSVAAAFFSSIGIEAAMSGNLTFQTGAVITITIPSLNMIFDTLMHTLGQWGIQQAIYKGMVQKPPAPAALPQGAK